MQFYGSGATKLWGECSFGHFGHTEAPPCNAPCADLSKLSLVSHSEHHSKGAKPGGEPRAVQSREPPAAKLLCAAICEQGSEAALSQPWLRGGHPAHISPTPLVPSPPAQSKKKINRQIQAARGKKINKDRCGFIGQLTKESSECGLVNISFLLTASTFHSRPFVPPDPPQQ